MHHFNFFVKQSDWHFSNDCAYVHTGIYCKKFQKTCQYVTCLALHKIILQVVLLSRYLKKFPAGGLKCSLEHKKIVMYVAKTT